MKSTGESAFKRDFQAPPVQTSEFTEREKDFRAGFRRQSRHFAGHSFLFNLIMMIALSVTPNQVWGMAGGARNRLAVMGGFARQGFVVPKSDFDHLDGVTYGLRLTRSWGRWNHGLDYSVVSGSRIKNFILSDNYSGTYQLEFSRIALLLGFASGKFASHLILGSEAIKWSGTPELGHKTTTSLFYGVDFSYDILVRQSVRVPLMLTVLSHPARSFDFSLYPNDSLVAQAAVEYQLATGVAIEF